MKTWEYWVIYLGNGGQDGWTRQLDEQGVKGWELVAVVANDSNLPVKAIMKREGTKTNLAARRSHPMKHSEEAWAILMTHGYQPFFKDGFLQSTGQQLRAIMFISRHSKSSNLREHGNGTADVPEFESDASMTDYATLSDRDLDARVAEVVMGIKCVQERHVYDDVKRTQAVKYQCQYPNGQGASNHSGLFGWGWHGSEADARACLPRYSTDIAAAFEVVEKMRERGWEFAILSSKFMAGSWSVQITKRGIVEEAIDASLPRAICLAALRAVEGEG